MPGAKWSEEAKARNRARIAKLKASGQPIVRRNYKTVSMDICVSEDGNTLVYKGEYYRKMGA